MACVCPCEWNSLAGPKINGIKIGIPFTLVQTLAFCFSLSFYLSSPHPSLHYFVFTSIYMVQSLFKCFAFSNCRKWIVCACIIWNHCEMTLCAVPETKTMRIYNHTNDSNLTTKQNEKKKSVRVKLWPIHDSISTAHAEKLHHIFYYCYD